MGVHLLESWALSRVTAALSSGESEFYAMGSGTARGPAIKHGLQWMAEMRGEPEEIVLELETDAAAARGLIIGMELDTFDTFRRGGFGAKT